MGIDDAYIELGLSADATEAEAKAAWRRLAAHWHPDRNRSPQALHKMQRINRALEEIRNARLPADRQGQGEDAGAPPPATDRNEETPAEGAAAPGAGPEGEHGSPERVLHHTVRLTLEEAVFGCIKELQGEVVDDCAACAATGVQILAGGCRVCGGAGQVRQPAWFGWLATLVTCEACAGDGIARESCRACDGTGKSAARKYRHRVRLPAGVRDGDLLHVPAQAQRPPPGNREALSLRVELLPHEFFTLDPDGTLRCELPVDGFAWIANRWIEVPTPAGLQQMRLNREHRVYRLKGQGFPVQRAGTRGDCLVTVVPLFPAEFSSEQEALLDRLVALNSGAADTVAGDRISAWQQTLRVWEDGLPRPPRRGKPPPHS